MEGGLNLFRTVGVLDEGIKAIFKDEVDKGKQKSTNMQSILEIKEKCDNFVTACMHPILYYEMQGIVSSLLKQQESQILMRIAQLRIIHSSSLIHSLWCG